MRISVLAVSDVGIPGQGKIGVKAWLALTEINTRLGVFPAPTQVVPQVIEVPSSHSQLGEGSLGNVIAGLKFPVLCMAFLMPVMQLEEETSDRHVELFLAYSAPTRVAPSSAAVLAVNMPISAIPMTSTIRIGAPKANSRAAIPSVPRKPLPLRGTGRVARCCLRLIASLSSPERRS
jgi:hypothetical protein